MSFPDERFPDVTALHRGVDAAAAQVEAALPAPLTCRRGCAGCCVDDLTVFEVEAAVIRALYPDVLRQAAGPVGRCAFLDADDSCRIYAARPYVCRTQGLALRWFEEEEDSGDILDRRDICPLNDAVLDITGATDEQLWLLGPYEEQLYDLQEGASGSPDRVALRSLFVGDGE
jgi:hypothetical protein